MKSLGTHLHPDWGWFWTAKYEISSEVVEIWPDGLEGIAVQENSLISLD
jgi:hypothetical protein